MYTYHIYIYTVHISYIYICHIYIYIHICPTFWKCWWNFLLALVVDVLNQWHERWVSKGAMDDNHFHINQGVKDPQNPQKYLCTLDLSFFWFPWSVWYVGWFFICSKQRSSCFRFGRCSHAIQQLDQGLSTRSMRHQTARPGHVVCC